MVNNSISDLQQNKWNYQVQSQTNVTVLKHTNNVSCSHSFHTTNSRIHHCWSAWV